MFEGNMSKQTPEWQEKMDQAAREHHAVDSGCFKEHNCNYVLHHAYRLVNEEVQRGTPWAKCQNCGSPYRTDNLYAKLRGADGTFCSSTCRTEAIAALDEGW